MRAKWQEPALSRAKKCVATSWRQHSLGQVSCQCLADDLNKDDRRQGGDVDHADAGDDVAHGRQNGLGDLVEDGHQGVVGVDGEPGEDRSEKDERRKDPGQDLDEGD